jgi:hypothetical protein
MYRRLILLGISCAFLASSAFAQATRTWISGVGDDVNPCSRTAPCKTFAGAISKTAAGGEINVLDPGGFGAITITKSITLLAVGMPAGVLVSGINGIVISNPTTSLMNVTIRGLDINGLGTGLSGILVNANSGPVNLHVENSMIYGFSTGGVTVNGNGPGNPTNVTVSNTRISECGATASGINADGSNGPVTVDVIGSEVHTCNMGLSMIGGAKFNARNSDFSQNTTGIDLAGATTVGTLDSSTISFGTTGINVETAGATIRLTNNTITDNTTGLATVGGGNIVSFGNNRIKGNTTNGAPTAALVQN